MKKDILILFIIGILLSGCTNGGTGGEYKKDSIVATDAYILLQDKHPNFYTVADFESEKTYSPICNYEIYIPRGYKKEKSYPLLLSFTINPKDWKNQADQYNCIVLTADCSKFIMAALREKMIASYSIDANNIYLTGFSSGAYLSFDLLYEFPDDYAGAILASGGALPTDTVPKNMKGKRFFITLGQNDFQENIDSAKALEKYLHNNNAQATLQLQPNSGHQYPHQKNSEMIKYILNK